MYGLYIYPVAELAGDGAEKVRRVLAERPGEDDELDKIEPTFPSLHLGDKRRGLADHGGDLPLGFSGLLLLIGPEKIFTGEHASLFGALAVLGGCTSWALGSLKARTAKLPAAPLLSTGMQMLAGGALLTLAGTLHGEWAQFHPSVFSLRSTLAVAYLILFGSIIAFSAYGWLVRNVSPSSISIPCAKSGSIPSSGAGPRG